MHPTMATKSFSFEQLGWDQLRTLLEVARGGSLDSAARKLGVDQSTVSRRLAQVEYSAGSALFKRDRKGLQLTALGQEVLVRLTQMEAMLHEIQGITAQGQSVSGRVAVVSMEGVGALLIARAMKALLERHPGLEIHLVTTSNFVDVARREADIFVGFFEPSSGSVTTHQVAEVPFHLYASRAYVGERRIASPDDLADDVFIGYIDDPVYLPAARWLESIVEKPKIAFRATSMFSQMFAAQEGLGVVMLPSYANAESLGLMKIVEDRCSMVPLYVSVQRDMQYLPHIRVVFETIAAHLQERIPG
jgi:DNA-binding transcriptional LysR family regulator